MTLNVLEEAYIIRYHISNDKGMRCGNADNNKHTIQENISRNWRQWMLEFRKGNNFQSL